jgi:hypothetical protein
MQETRIHHYLCAGMHSTGFSGPYRLTYRVRRPGRPGDSLRRVPRRSL